MAGRQPAKKAQGPLNDIACDTCPATFSETGELAVTEERARIRGWAIWRGRLGSGAEVTIRACPKCRDNRSRGTRAERLTPPPGSQPLF